MNIGPGKQLDIFISYKRGEGDDAAREIKNYTMNLFFII